MTLRTNQIIADQIQFSSNVFLQYTPNLPGVYISSDGTESNPFPLGASAFFVGPGVSGSFNSFTYAVNRSGEHNTKMASDWVLQWADSTNNAASNNDLFLSRSAEAALRIANDGDVSAPLPALELYNAEDSSSVFITKIGAANIGIGQTQGSVNGTITLQNIVCGGSTTGITANGLQLGNVEEIRWSTSSAYNGAADIRLRRIGASTIAFDDLSTTNNCELRVYDSAGTAYSSLTTAALNGSTSGFSIGCSGGDLTLSPGSGVIAAPGDVLNVGDGSASAPAYSFNDEPTSGLYRTNPATLTWAVLGGIQMSLTTAQLNIKNNRLANYSHQVVSKTEGVGSPYAIVQSNDGALFFTNEGATAQVYIDLPTASSGLTYNFVVQDADGIRITANTADTVRIGADVSAAAGYISSTEVGASISVVAINATEWIAYDVVGTWTVDGVVASSPLTVDELTLDDGAGIQATIGLSNGDGAITVRDPGGASNGQIRLLSPGGSTVYSNWDGGAFRLNSGQDITWQDNANNVFTGSQDTILQRHSLGGWLALRGDGSMGAQTPALYFYNAADTATTTRIGGNGIVISGAGTLAFTETDTGGANRGVLDMVLGTGTMRFYNNSATDNEFRIYGGGIVEYVSLTNDDANSYLTSTVGAMVMDGPTGAILRYNGGNRIQVSSSSMTFSVATHHINGTNSAPPYSFTADPDTGFYLAAEADMRVAIAGVDRIHFDSSGVTAMDGSTIRFGNSEDLILSRPLEAMLRISNDGDVAAPQPAIDLRDGDSATSVVLTRGGNAILQVGSSQGSTNGTVSATAFRGGAGSAAAPTYNFTNNSGGNDDGFYSVGAASAIGVSIAGTEEIRFSANGINVVNNVGWGATTSGIDTYFYRVSEGIVGLRGDGAGTPEPSLRIYNGAASAYGRYEHDLIASSAISGIYFRNSADTADNARIGNPGGNPGLELPANGRIQWGSAINAIGSGDVGIRRDAPGALRVTLGGGDANNAYGAIMSGPWGSWGPSTSTNMRVSGVLFGSDVTETDDTSASGADTVGGYFEQSTSAVANNVAESRQTSTHLLHLEHRPILRFKFSLQTTTNVRFFIGVAHITTAVDDGDNMTNQYVGLQFSTNRADTNFTFVTDDGATQATHASTEAVTTDTYILEIFSESSTSCFLYLRDPDGTLVDSHEFTGNLPAETTGLAPMIGTETLTTSAATHRIYYAMGWQREGL